MKIKEKPYRSICKDCANAFKHYSGIGNSIVFTNVSTCILDPHNEKGKQFDDIKKCENYVKAKPIFPKGETGQQLFHLYRRLEEISEILYDIIDILIPDEEDIALNQAEIKATDE